MKKIFILSLGMLFISTTQAQSLNCSEKTTIAVDKYGSCRAYSNPCRVPSDWRIMPATSCEDIESKEDLKTSTTDVNNRRFKQKTLSLRERILAKRKQTKQTSSNFSRVGRGALTKRDTSNYNEASSSTTQRAKRTFGRSLGSYEVKQRAYGELREELSEDAVEEYKKQGLRRPAKMARHQAIRTGTLKNEPSLYQRQERLFSNKKSYGSSPYWQSHQSRRAANRVKKEHTPRTINLRRTYRGSQEASLDDMTNSQ